MASKYQTQWIGQFAVASELVRRNYLVSMPLGNALVRDLIVLSPNQKTLSIQVKSFRPKGFIPTGSVRQEITDIWFVFVHVPTNLQQPLEYYILSKEDLLNILKQEKEKARIRKMQRGKPYVSWSEGLSYRKLVPFQGQWDILPN